MACELRRARENQRRVKTVFAFVSADEEDYNTMMTSMENLNHTSQVSSTPCNKVNPQLVN